MDVFVKQKDDELAMLEMVPGVGVREYGCLTVAIFNILKRHRRVKGTFNAFLNALKENKAYTHDGLLMWEPVKLICGIEHRILPKNGEFRADDRYEYIVQVPYKDTGHFCEVYYVSKDGLIIYRDSYDGELKEITRSKCLTVRELRLME
jgi:hypothetical protein